MTFDEWWVQFVNNLGYNAERTSSYTYSREAFNAGREQLEAENERLNSYIKENHDRAEEIIKGREGLIFHLHNQVGELEAENERLNSYIKQTSPRVDVDLCYDENVRYREALERIVNGDGKWVWDLVEIAKAALEGK